MRHATTFRTCKSKGKIVIIVLTPEEPSGLQVYLIFVTEVPQVPSILLLGPERGKSRLCWLAHSLAGAVVCLCSPKGDFSVLVSVVAADVIGIC